MATATALVLKPITRCEFGTRDQGLMAEVFDRVSVLSTGPRFSNGSRLHHCLTDAGETFYASDAMVQVD